MRITIILRLVLSLLLTGLVLVTGIPGVPVKTFILPVFGVYVLLVVIDMLADNAAASSAMSVVRLLLMLAFVVYGTYGYLNRTQRLISRPGGTVSKKPETTYRATFDYSMWVLFPLGLAVGGVIAMDIADIAAA